jgi:Cu/Ag efflux protein CusF
VKIFTLVLCAGLLLACGQRSSGPERHYNLTGKIVSLDKNRQTATVDAAAIPNYMEAMTMEYPVKSKSDFDALRVGEQISARVDVKSDDSYALSDIKPQKK